MKNVLDELTAMGPLPVEKQSPRVARNLPSPATAAVALLSRQGKPAMAKVAKVWHFTVPSPDGGLLVRAYRGVDAPAASSPALVYFHGGGWVIADLDTYDASCRALANLAKCTVFSVAYRQAPEHKYPAAHDDAYRATKWIIENGREQGADTARVAIAGESAGGNLALATVLRMKRSGERLPVHAVAVYPIADYSQDTASYKEHAQAKPLNAPMMSWFFDHYLRSAADGQDDFISLVNAKDWSGACATTFVFAEIDPLRSEGQTLAQRMQASGVSVTSQLYTGVAHEFFGMGALVPEALQAEKFVAESLRRSWMASAKPAGKGTGSSGR